MQALLDTQSLIWFIEGNPALSTSARQVIYDPSNELFVSRVSFFEMAIKQKIGKLTIGRGLQGLIQDTFREGIRVLPVENAHLLAYDRIPLHPDHRDPFDRLILATAVQENLPVISSGKKFDWYPDLVRVIW